MDFPAEQLCKCPRIPAGDGGGDSRGVPAGWRWLWRAVPAGRALPDGPGGPRAGSLRFPGGFVCEKMRESQSACKELVNSGGSRSQRGEEITFGLVFVAGRLLRDQS